jgi:hypothetical protein
VVTFGAELAGASPFAYNWDLGPFGSSISPTVTIDFGQSGSYDYVLSVSNCEGSHDEATGTVSVTCEEPRRNQYLPLIVRKE